MSGGKSANCMTTCHKVIYDKDYIEAILEETGDEKIFIIASKTLDTTSNIVSNLVARLDRSSSFDIADNFGFGLQAFFKN